MFYYLGISDIALIFYTPSLGIDLQDVLHGQVLVVGYNECGVAPAMIFYRNLTEFVTTVL